MDQTGMDELLPLNPKPSVKLLAPDPEKFRKVALLQYFPYHSFLFVSDRVVTTKWAASDWFSA